MGLGAGADRRSEVQAHFDGLAGSYDALKARRGGYHRALLAVYAGLCRDAGRASVLEIGCGTGALLASLAPARGVGVDISEAMVARARANHPGAALEFVCTDAETLDLGRCFDWVLLPDVIEHLYEPAAGLARAAAHLAPGGSLVITWANHHWTPLLHLLEAAGLKMAEGPHRWLAPDEVVALLRPTGLALARAETHALLPAGGRGLAAASRLLGRLPGLRDLGLIRLHVYRDPPRGTP